MSDVARPQCVVIAGPNGAGKTSSAPGLLRDTVGIDAFVNADVIAQGLAGFSPHLAAFEAGRIMLRRLIDLSGARSNVAFESTLSGRSTAQLLKDFLRRGYEVHIFYLYLPSPEMAVTRVRDRVEAGGHDVPASIVHRRFWRSARNFDCLYRRIATTWRLYDTGALDARLLVAHGTETEANVVIDSAKWHEFLALARRTS